MPDKGAARRVKPPPSSPPPVSSSREAFLIWASSELGVVRQIPRELDAVDDTVGCGDGHHLDVFGGFDGILALAHLMFAISGDQWQSIAINSILALAHLMFGEPSGRPSIAINSNQ